MAETGPRRPYALSISPLKIWVQPLVGSWISSFFAEGRKCSFWEATTIVLQLREAKNDQFVRGQVRTHHITFFPLCPIISFREHARHNPEWMADPARPVFAHKGRGVSREDSSSLLKLGSVALGYPPDFIGSHSLRKRGATALYAATGDMELVKRFGGRKSEAVHAYLYSDLHGGQSHASHMLRSKPALQPQQRSRSSPPPGREARGRAERDADCRAGFLDLAPELPLLLSGVVLTCPIAGGHTAYCDCSIFHKQSCVCEDISVRSTCLCCHGFARCNISACVGCACPTGCGATTCNSRSYFRIGCSTPSVQVPYTGFRVAPTIAAMANNCDAAPPDPWTERRMKDWLLEGRNAWGILGIPPQSSMEVVVRAFRRLSIRYHPDKNSHKSPEE